MADNTQLDAGSGGDVIATDDISGVKHQRVKLEFGGDGVATEIDHRDALPTIDLATSAAFALDSDLLTWNANGYSDDINGTAETFWSAGAGSWQDSPNTTAETINVASTDANDTAAGTGARTVRIYGLNSSGAYATDDISMNGTTSVGSSITFLVVFRIEVLTVGSGATNAGALTATGNTSSATYAYALAGIGTSEQATFAIPSGMTGIIRHWRTGVVETATSGGVESRLQIWVPTTQPTWRVVARSRAEDGSPSEMVFDPPIVVPATARIRVQGIGQHSNMICTSGFDVLCRA